MTKKRREYTNEFKIDAAKLVEEQGYTVNDTAERLGIPQANLTRWLRQYRKGQLEIGKQRATPTTEEAEVRELKAEVKRLEQEIAILKKAASYFARQMT